MRQTGRQADRQVLTITEATKSFAVSPCPAWVVVTEISNIVLTVVNFISTDTLTRVHVHPGTVDTRDTRARVYFTQISCVHVTGARALARGEVHGAAIMACFTRACWEYTIYQHEL